MTTTGAPSTPSPPTILNLVGVAVYGPRNAIDKVFRGATLHP